MTRKTWPGVAGVVALKPLYEINARLGFVGLTKTPVTNRPGSAVDSESSLVNVTALAGSASAFAEMKTRPVVVAAHNVDVFDGARSTAATAPPARSPHAASVSRVGPSSTQ